MRFRLEVDQETARLALIGRFDLAAAVAETLHNAGLEEVFHLAAL